MGERERWRARARAASSVFGALVWFCTKVARAARTGFPRHRLRACLTAIQLSRTAVCAQICAPQIPPPHTRARCTAAERAAPVAATSPPRAASHRHRRLVAFLHLQIARHISAYVTPCIPPSVSGSRTKSRNRAAWLPTILSPCHPCSTLFSRVLLFGIPLPPHPCTLTVCSSSPSRAPPLSTSFICSVSHAFTMNAFVSLPNIGASSASTALRPSQRLTSSMRPTSFVTPLRLRSLSPSHNAPVMLEKSTQLSSQSIGDLRKQRLAELITSGPVFKSAELSISDLTVEHGCSTDARQTCLDDWLQTGAILEKALGRQANDIRVYQYYLPVYFWILRELDRFNEAIANSGARPRPFILGFCCPQGGGKTTMTTFMEILLRAAGRSVQIASLDDFYLTNAEQRRVADEYPTNRLMQYRGMPGTHDLALLNNTLDALRRGQDVSIPRYDKTAFAGRGDRAPKNKWKHISDATDVVLLEGWCLGFEPVPADQLVDPELSVVNEALRDFVTIYDRFDGMFIIEIGNMDWVYEWRLQAERGTRAAGRPGLSDEQVVDFVSRFMPAYKQYSPRLYRRKEPLFPNHELHIEIDQMRRPVHRKSEC
eukprot:TRINITY_DN4099_c0_g1_i1.p1 TRINITY_DN4099_c0_g1~~TRINITY_DN4099_c0_g1_i1.p1  ORF type:complete len:598 (+),score=88.08 TRINITY_DN4099_c0_g1_i1:4154-5947(+)